MESNRNGLDEGESLMPRAYRQHAGATGEALFGIGPFQMEFPDG